MEVLAAFFITAVEYNSDSLEALSLRKEYYTTPQGILIKWTVTYSGVLATEDIVLHFEQWLGGGLFVRNSNHIQTIDMLQLPFTDEQLNKELE